jgi:hypothetical protein
MKKEEEEKRLRGTNTTHQHFQRASVASSHHVQQLVNRQGAFGTSNEPELRYSCKVTEQETMLSAIVKKHSTTQAETKKDNGTSHARPPQLQTPHRTKK